MSKSTLRDRLEHRIAALIEACPRCWGALVEGFAEGRLQGVVGQGDEHRETRERARIPRDAFTAAALAALVERNVRAAAALAIEGKPERAAALDRPIVAERWPLEVGPAWGESDEDIAAIVALNELPSYAEDEGGWESDGWVWPATVNAFDVGDVIAKGGTEESSLIADALRKGFYSPGHGFRFNVGEVVTIGGIERARPLPPSPAETWFRANEEQTFDGLLLWSPVGFAVVLAALAEVRAGALALRGTPLPATRPMRAAMAAVSRGRGSADTWQIERTDDRCAVSLHWPGARARAHQLTLGFPGSVTAEIVGGVLDELQADGLRDYLLLHRMAAEQGRTGDFRWAWSELRERTAYARRIKEGDVSDAEAQRAVTARLVRLQSAELRMITTVGGKEVFKRVGPFGLIDIPAGGNAVGARDALDAAVIRLNPAIYRGAAVGTAKGERHFTMLPDAAFALDGNALRLAVLLVMRMRDEADDGGDVSLRASTLWEYLGVRGGDASAIPRKRWPAVDRTLRKVLDVLEGASVIGSWDRAGGEVVLPGSLYRIAPVAAWRDAVVHRVPPSLPPSKAAVPWTGEGLRAWRAGRGLSQAAAAAALGVSSRTILRAEATGAKGLGAALVDKLAALAAVTRNRTRGPSGDKKPDPRTQR